MRIGLFGRKNDPHVLSLRKALQEAGGIPVVIDFHNFPRFNWLAMGDRIRFDDIHLRGTLDLDDLDAACIRTICFDWPVPMDGHTPRKDALDPKGFTSRLRAEVMKVATQASVVRALAARIPIINPPESARLHRQKALQHHRLLLHGIPTPDTVVTNDSRRIQAFLARHEGRVVVKPQAGGAEVVMADDAFFERFRDLLRYRPLMFQQFVSGRSFRCYVVGGTVVSMGEIRHDRQHVDWRERVQAIVPVEPPTEIECMIRRAVEHLDLPFCAIDLEEDATTGIWYFLDFNPSPLFVHWSRVTGAPIARHLARYLVAIAGREEQTRFRFAPGEA